MEFNFGARDEFRYDLVNKQTGKRSYSIQYCYGNIYEQINEYRSNIKKMCLLNVSNDTHEIVKVTSLANGKILFEDGRFKY